MAIMMEGILRIYGLLFGGARDMDLDDEGDFVDMVEGNLEEDMELVQEENMRRRANAQEQVKRRGGRERRMRGEIITRTVAPQCIGTGKEGGGRTKKGRQMERRD